MFTSETRVRVHYALTDQMGFVYYGHYAQFYEIGRAEAIRALGYTYRDIEALGIIMPVGSMECRYLKPARYDDLLTVRTILKELPKSNKVTFHHEIYNETGEKLNTGEVSLHFMDKAGLKPSRIPQPLLEKFVPYFP
jgi:acyl-CoA thioester hydrolase